MKRADLLREVATLVQAGVPLSKGLQHLIPNLPRHLQVEAALWQKVLEQGKPLSSAFVESGESFGPGAIALVEAGEISGQLAESLQVLAQESEIRDRRLSRLTTALIYPVILIHAAALIPSLGTWYQQGLAAALFQAAAVLVPVYLLFALLWLAWKMRSGNSGIALFIDRCLLPIPFLGPTLVRLSLARWGRILACLMDAGIRLEDALEQAAGACGNAAVAANLVPRSRDILRGHSVSQILQDSRLADALITATVQTGETSGTLPRALRDMAGRAEFQSQQNLDRMAALLPIACYLGGVAIVVAQMVRILSPVLQTYQELLP